MQWLNEIVQGALRERHEVQASNDSYKLQTNPPTDFPRIGCVVSSGGATVMEETTREDAMKLALEALAKREDSTARHE
uniref:DRBM domain-containing protein n=1 Tax=Mycena chlorophos TaxID=658473 RepID=A0ABQ0LKS9_MYCCL|nr:predicted protein [Mycena chlorophos]